jgi:hypothetical protein
MPGFYCRLCNTQIQPIFSSEILKKYTITYYHCNNCGLLQTENPYWLKESYHESINSTDTGILARNIDNSKIVASIIFFFFNKNAKFLDFAGGFGISTRLMRDIGFDFFWFDPFTDNLVARGFEYSDNLKIELVTCFECFEHLVNPREDIEKMLAISKNIFFTTSLLPNPVPKPDQWWYYGLEHGQHIAFYSKETLQFISRKYGLFLYSVGNFHLLTKKRISPFFFKFVVIFHDALFYLLIKRQRNSRTFGDMNYLIKKME